MAFRILLADDHVVVRQGLRGLLERAGFEVVGEADNGQDAIALAEKLHPDAAVLDIAMPVLNGIDAARGISKVSDRTRIILLTMYTQDNFVRESLRAGVRGYVIKAAAADELDDDGKSFTARQALVQPGHLAVPLVEPGAQLVDLTAVNRKLGGDRGVRLARTLCSECKEEYEPPRQLLAHAVNLGLRRAEIAR